MAVKLSALRAGRPLPPRKIPGTRFCQRLSRPQGHSAAGMIRSIEKSNGLIGIRSRDLPACSIVPQPATLCKGDSKYFLPHLAFCHSPMSSVILLMIPFHLRYRPPSYAEHAPHHIILILGVWHSCPRLSQLMYFSDIMTLCI
jgi:hypothetical protein